MSNTERDELSELCLSFLKPPTFAGGSWTLNPDALADAILASSVLVSRDRRMKAEALEEAAAIADRWSDQLHRDSTSVDDDYSVFADEIANQIRARAGEIREENN